jgi:hypothetical protein
MLFLNSLTAFYRIVFAVIWRIVKQLNQFADMICEFNHSLEKLGALTAALRAIVDFDLKQANAVKFF